MGLREIFFFSIFLLQDGPLERERETESSIDGRISRADFKGEQCMAVTLLLY